MNRPLDAVGEETCSVSFTARDVRDAARLLGRIADARFQPAAHMVGLAHPEADQNKLVSRARAALAERRRRKQHFGSGMLGEPAWDMLLILYSEQHLSRCSVGQLSRSAELPPTTALRWLEYLEQRGLVARRQNPTDARAVLVEITDQGRQALNLYFSETFASTR